MIHSFLSSNRPNETFLCTIFVLLSVRICLIPIPKLLSDGIHVDLNGMETNLYKQECIPVGCFPPARYHTGVSVQGGLCPGGLCPGGSLSGGAP